MFFIGTSFWSYGQRSKNHSLLWTKKNHHWITKQVEKSIRKISTYCHCCLGYQKTQLIKSTLITLPTNQTKIPWWLMVCKLWWISQSFISIQRSSLRVIKKDDYVKNLT